MAPEGRVSIPWLEPVYLTSDSRQGIRTTDTMSAEYGDLEVAHPVKEENRSGQQHHQGQVNAHELASCNQHPRQDHVTSEGGLRGCGIGQVTFWVGLTAAAFLLGAIAAAVVAGMTSKALKKTRHDCEAIVIAFISGSNNPKRHIFNLICNIHHYIDSTISQGFVGSGRSHNQLPLSQ
ncbi:uncharacterized protein BDZ83DRAFT_645655 [Colletotrichum acutatum]|uniref:Uncharacterized protein n=1 Tax=Glomerella acutata TaxID=27357 RepID=A0AAD8XQF0_GLOAC|nr:uncharacterized protein BDZ83DRAFT_645655 [Colletotrichum acutatum]KAK1731655.1 hypothetical protein BDZ83DRAFT_645655 [Colletotrichum acutatum]